MRRGREPSLRSRDTRVKANRWVSGWEPLSSLQPRGEFRKSKLGTRRQGSFGCERGEGAGG